MRDSEWGEAFRGASGRRGGGTYRAPPKNSAYRSECQRPQGHRDGCAIPLVGAGIVDSEGLVMGEGFVTCGRRDGCVVALVGAGGCGLRSTWNGARLYEVRLGAWGEGRTEARPKIVSVCQGVKGPRGSEMGVL